MVEPSRNGHRSNGHRPDLSVAELALWSELIERRCGLVFGESRSRFLAYCLWQRVKERAFSGYSDYYRFVARDPGAEAEWARLAELVVNQESGFFRHQPSFDALVRRAVPELVTERRRQGIAALTAWSAGCAAGQETYSMAMALLTALDGAPGAGRWQVKVCGSDLSARAIERARGGRYPERALRNLPAVYRQRFWKPVAGDPRGSWQAGEELKSAVAFGRLNLCRADDYWVGLQDVVFCQNVLIYFRPERRERVLAELARRLRPGGWLFPAPGEVVGLETPGLSPVHCDGTVVFQREA